MSADRIPDPGDLQPYGGYEFTEARSRERRDELGRQGWQLVCVLLVGDDLLYFLERPIAVQT